MAKSWDIQPNRKVAAPAPQPKETSAARPTRRAVEPMVRRAALQKAPQRKAASRPGMGFKKKEPVRPRQEPEPVKTTLVRRERVPTGRDREPLKNRRKRARHTMRTVFSITFVILVLLAIGALWLPQVRIQSIQASGPDASAIQTLAQDSLQGAYYFVIPRDSIFFFSESAIRHAILTHYPDIAAVAVSRSSFQSITLSSIARESAFLWCGTTPDSTGTTLVDVSATTSADAILPPCYEADSQGVIFDQVAQDPSATDFRIYDAIDSPSDSPIGARLEDASALTNAIQLVKVLKSLNVAVVSLALRSDEADLYTQGGTKITYVIGQEDAAAKLAEAAFPTLNLNDGSLEYVDLRFSDKVYFKKKGETASAATSTSSQ